MNASFQAMLHGFFDFENFDLEEYEHYEVRSTMHSAAPGRSARFHLESGERRLELDRSSETAGFLRPTCEE